MYSDNAKRNRNGKSDLDNGLRFTNGLVMRTKIDHFESLIDLHGLIDLLISKSIINSRELNQKREIIRESLKEEFMRDQFQVHLDPTPDKYKLPVSGVDCEQRHNLCKAGCCTMRVTLSTQDLDEGMARWEYGSPYYLAVGKDGYCVHIDRETLRCGIYEHRPAACRTYSCRNDERIWKDFEAKIPAVKQL